MESDFQNGIDFNNEDEIDQKLKYHDIPTVRETKEKEKNRYRMRERA